MVVVEAVVVVVVGVAPLDEPASTSACAFSLETCIPTVRVQSPGSEQLTAESVLLVDCKEGSFDCSPPCAIPRIDEDLGCRGRCVVADCHAVRGVRTGNSNKTVVGAGIRNGGGNPARSIPGLRKYLVRTLIWLHDGQNLAHGHARARARTRDVEKLACSAQERASAQRTMSGRSKDSATGTTFDPVEVEPTAVQATSLVHGQMLSRESVLPVPE